jgi:pyrophosphatase PpaX
MNAVLWDLDDTLLDTLPARMRALSHAYERCLGGSVDPLELWRSHRGGTLEDLGRRLMGDRYRDFSNAYRDRYYGESTAAPPFPGIHETLEALAGAEVPMAVVTSKDSWGATEELSRAGLLQFVAAVVGFDDTDMHKPEPDPVFMAMERLVVDDPAGTLFVGDSPADVRAARNAGCIAVGATWGTLEEGLLRDAGPHHLATTPSGVLTLIAETPASYPVPYLAPKGEA